MFKKRKRWLLSAIAAGSMFAAIGCEAVEGVDLNSAVTSMYTVESSVGEFSFNWDIIPDEATLEDEEMERMLELFGTGSLVVTEYRQEHIEKVSFEGFIELKKGSIPFAFYMDDQSIVVDIEGAKAPYKLDLNEMPGADPAMMFGGGELEELFGPEENMKLTQALVSFVVLHIDNPDNISVSRVSEELDGAPKSLTKVTAELDFEEATQLLASTLSGMASDEEGFHALIGTFYDVFKPLLEYMAEQNPDDPIAAMALRDKELAVRFAYGMIAPQLEKAAAELTAASDPGELAEDMLTEDSGMSFDLLLDGTNPAGLDMDLYISPETEDKGGIKAVQISVSSRWWDANEAVTAAEYNGKTAPLPIDAKPRHRLDNIAKTSLLYDILKNDLHATKHSFDMYMGMDASEPDGFSPYIKGEGTTMVPVRFVSEELDAEVQWDDATSTITVKDPVENITVVLKIGDKTATVNGQQQTLPEAPEIIYDSTFVPIAFITRALGGSTQWDGEYGIVTIEKEF